MSDIDFYFDFASPYGFIAAVQIDALGRPENDQAIRRGVFGSPFFLMGGEPFWGSDRISWMISAPGPETEVPAARIE
jgi:2-hydroxychromene-2-carboxylate isomerase